MYAYFIPGLDPRGGMEALRAHPAGRRLVHVGKWQLSARNGGALATWAGTPLGQAYGDPVPTFDGMEYLPPLEWPEDSKAALVRSPLPECTQVETQGGPLLVGVATRAPRARRFAGGSSLGSPTGKLAEEAHALWERFAAKEQILINDSGLSRVLFLAVASCYRVTEEALDDLGWLTTADDDLVTMGVFGLDPKAVPGAGDTSPSQPPGSSPAPG